MLYVWPLGLMCRILGGVSYKQLLPATAVDFDVLFLSRGLHWSDGGNSCAFWSVLFGGNAISLL